MADLATLRRRRREAEIAYRLACIQPKWKRGREKARKALATITAALLRAELGHRKAAPLHRNRQAQVPAADLFNQLGA